MKIGTLVKVVMPDFWIQPILMRVDAFNYIVIRNGGVLSLCLGDNISLERLLAEDCVVYEIDDINILTKLEKALLNIYRRIDD